MKYLLLRDNKQTGPYSTEELIAKGLKPYDLVWLEGRSAAWRYPSEIQELKPYAPAVEEQPYDRFYKKPQHSTTALEQAAAKEKLEAMAKEAEVKKEIVTPQLKKEVAANNLVADERPVPVIKSLPSKKIYVTLPAANGAAGAINGTYGTNGAGVNGASNLAASPAAVKKENGTIQQAIPEQYAIPGKMAEPVDKELNGKPVAEHKATQLVVADESSEYSSFSRRVETSNPAKEKLAIPQEPLNRESGRSNRKLIVRSLVAACLLLGGVVIGLAISYSRQQTNNQDLEKLVKAIQEREKKSQLPPAASKPNPASTVDSIALNTIAAKTNGTSSDVNTGQERGSTSTNHPLAQYTSKKDNAAPQQREIKPVSLTVSRPDETNTVPSIGNGQEKRESTQAAAEATRKNISQLVLVDISKYKTGVLGGISNLRLTISNNSNYPLDQVLVEVKYLGPEKNVVKTQTVTFSDIAPGGQKTLDAPRSSRGVSVDYTITRINSRALGLAQLGL